LDQWSLEAQLHLHGSGSIDGLVGAHYYDGSSERDNYQLVPLSAPLPSVDSHSTEGEKAAGIFGQTNVRLSDRTGFTSGLRLSGEETRVTTIGTGLQDSPTLLVDERSSDEVSWRLDLEHAIAADALLYAGVSTGYNSGGVITSLLVNGEPDRFDPEYLTAYEAGAKSQWLKRRLTLNAAAFYYDFEDMQVQTVRFDGSNQVAEVDNAARAELYGIDAEASFEIRERLTLSGGVVWMPKREFVEFVNDATGDTLSGNEMVRAPEWSATSAVSGEHLFGAIGTLGARIELNYRSGVFYTKENNPLIAQDDVTLLNLFLTLEHGSGRWYVFASGRNLTDEDYFHQVFLQSSPGYPDTYESGVGFRF
jgi:iron complex outermembrane receptor protein